VAEFLGWTRRQAGDRETLKPNWECDVAFRVIDMMAEGLIDAKTLVDLKATTSFELTLGRLRGWTAASGRRLAGSLGVRRRRVSGSRPDRP
jgi:hypothetical protein